METFIAFIDNEEHALQQLMPMLESSAHAHWVLVGCPPVFSRHATRWVTQGALKKWRANWTQHNLKILVALCESKGLRVSTRTASGPLLQTTRQLLGEFPLARIVDARLPKLGVKAQAVTQSQPTNASPWVVPGSLVAMGALLAAASE
jgi:hypothetical protein